MIGPLMLSLRGTSLSTTEIAWLQQVTVGGVILFTRNYESRAQLSDLIAVIRATANRPILIAVDQEGGRVQRFQDEFTQLPSASKFGDLYQRNEVQALSTAEAVGWLMAIELRTLGIDFSFAPVADCDHGISAVIGSRAFHQNPVIVARLTAAYMQGMHRAGMAAVAKHFPGHGAVTADSHFELPQDPRAFEGLLQHDLIPFQHLIRNGIDAIMPAHIVYSLDKALSASFSKVWLQQVLREELAFAGAVFSDCLSMQATNFIHDVGERAILALQAGCDQVLVCNDESLIQRSLEVLSCYQVATERSDRLLKLYRGDEVVPSLATITATSAWQHAQQRLQTMLSEQTLAKE